MRAKAFWPEAWAPLGLAAIVVLLFQQHLAGNLTFPWDFQGGYYTHAVARLRDGSFLSPPLWLPWGGFGIPGHLSLQDGTWYLPQYVFPLMGWPYDIVGATRLQVAHVALGAIGAYALLRHLGMLRAASGLAALAYLFSGSFYSNAQHVDIVRGAALFPWLLFGIDALLRRVTAGRLALCVLLAWQFLVASYPGMVVAGAYAAAALVLVRLWMSRHDAAIGRHGLAFVALAGLIAAGLAMVKFLPALVDTANIRQEAGAMMAADAKMLTTLFLDFDVDLLANDVTMRDLFLPLPVFVLAAVGANRSVAGILGGLLAVAALLVMADIDAWQRLLAHLPLMRVSRFPISDFRPVLHLGLCMLAANGLAILFGDRPRPRGVLLRVGLGTAVVVAGLLYARHVGHPAARLWLPVGALVLTVAICAWMALRPVMSARGRGAAALGLAALLLGSGMDHVLHNARVWKAPRSDAAEIALYGRTIHSLAGPNRFEALTFRPARMVFTPLPAGRMELYDARYNLGWIAEGFSAFGYEDLKGSAVFRRIYDSALADASPEQRSALAWLLRPSSTLLAASPGSVAPTDLERCQVGRCRVEGVPVATQARMEAFRENGAIYTVRAAAPVALVENEAWYPGWKSLLCTASGCRPGPGAEPALTVLRAWALPPGEFRLITYFEPPMWSIARAISWSALAALLLILAALVHRRVRPGPSQTPVSTLSHPPSTRSQ